ncbi:hypothetical protein [Streptomyces roseochromogenus]|nr:hypothetical protein [Streptomyces roseochromogenus]
MISQIYRPVTDSAEVRARRAAGPARLTPDRVALLTRDPSK